MEAVISRQHYFWRLFTVSTTLVHTYVDLSRNTITFQMPYNVESTPNKHRINPDSTLWPRINVDSMLIKRCVQAKVRFKSTEWRPPPTSTRPAVSHHQKYRIQTVLMRCHKVCPYRDTKRKEENYTPIHEHYPPEVSNNT